MYAVVVVLQLLLLWHICTRSDSQNMRRMTTAIRLNQVIRQHSTDAKLIIVNMPKPPKDEDGEKSCIFYCQPPTLLSKL